jgi:hypothetical protein
VKGTAFRDVSVVYQGGSSLSSTNNVCLGVLDSSSTFHGTSGAAPCRLPRTSPSCSVCDTHRAALDVLGRWVPRRAYFTVLLRVHCGASGGCRTRQSVNMSTAAPLATAASLVSIAGPQDLPGDTRPNVEVR